MSAKNGLNILLEKYEELHNVLCDYNLEDFFIGQIHRTIQASIDALPAGTKIGFRPYGFHARWVIRNFDFKHLKIIGMFDKKLTFNIEGIPVYEISSEESEDVEVFIMTSYYSREEIVSELEAAGQSYLDIYRCLENNNLKLHAPVDLYVKGGPAILHDYLMRWKKAVGNERETALKELLTVACEEKDFFMLDCLCKRYELDFPFVSCVRKKYNELYALLEKLIGERKQKDILMYWIDALPYKWKQYLKGLSLLAKESLCFNQTYTCTPYTDQTYRAIFSRLLPLTDWEKSLYKIGSDNSELIQYLKGKNYAVCRIGEETPVYDLRCMKEEVSISFDIGCSCNIVLWTTLCKMISEDKPVFLIAHMVLETHPPTLCPELENLIDVYKADDSLEQVKISANYLDQRVMYYHRILRGGQRVQIFMSDHGEHITNQFPQWYWAQHKLHAWCFVSGNQIGSKQENRIFSYLKFIDLVKWLIEPEKYDYEECLSDHVVFQDTDIYSEEVGNRFIKKGEAEKALAYRGALDGTYKYAINGIGREFFYKIVNDKDVEIQECEALEYFERLRNIAGTVFPDLSCCEKFKHVPKIYTAIKELENYSEGYSKE